jgi:predicted transcriptional regulator
MKLGDSSDQKQDQGAPQLGSLELDVLRYISDHAPVTLREVIDGYGIDKGLARTTILTVMDRLRRKGHLERHKEMEGGTRRRKDGFYVYVPAVNKTRLMSDVVRGFVDKTLGGSLAPFVSYLVDAKGLTTEEAEQLRRLIED